MTDNKFHCFSGLDAHPSEFLCCSLAYFFCQIWPLSRTKSRSDPWAKLFAILSIETGVNGDGAEIEPLGANRFQRRR